jgi:hypothetical protein
MNAPLKLTERQLLIYFYLYRKCDFDNMEVKVTTSQITTGIKIIDLTDRIVNTELKKMIEAGFLKLVKKGSKGNFSIYKIIKTSELSVTNAYVISSLKDSNSNALDSKEVTNAYVIGNSNTKNKEKDNNKKEKESNLDKIISSYTNNNDLAETIKDFIKMRKAIKKTVTDRALKGILTKLDKFSNSDIDKIEILEKSIENCWISVYELKNKKPPAGTDGKEKKVFNNNNISNNNKNYTQKIEGSKFI